MVSCPVGDGCDLRFPRPGAFKAPRPEGEALGKEKYVCVFKRVLGKMYVLGSQSCDRGAGTLKNSGSRGLVFRNVQT